MLQAKTDAVGIIAGKAGAIGGGSAAFIFGLSANEVAAVGGVLVAVLGWLTQMYFNRRRDRREADEHEARMAQYRQRGSANVKALAAGGGAIAVVLAAAAFIAPREGLELKPYRDIVGRVTWCYGETRGTAKTEYTKAECDALLRGGVAGFHAEMAECIHKPLTEPQWVAVLSWSYNVGTGAACGSTLVRKINAGAPPEAWCRQLLRWDYAGSKRVRGLTNRRQAEYAECLK